MILLLLVLLIQNYSTNLHIKVATVRSTQDICGSLELVCMNRVELLKNKLLLRIFTASPLRWCYSNVSIKKASKFYYFIILKCISEHESELSFCWECNSHFLINWVCHDNLVRFTLQSLLTYFLRNHKHSFSKLPKC